MPEWNMSATFFKLNFINVEKRNYFDERDFENLT